MLRWTLCAALAALTACMPAQAHHSIASVYDSNRRVTVEGVVARFEFINPHPFLTIEVEGRDGEVQPWRLEMDNRSELAAIGMTSTTFRAGDRIVVQGSALRSGSNGLYIFRLDRQSDGFRYEQVGSIPKIVSPGTSSAISPRQPPTTR